MPASTATPPAVWFAARGAHVQYLQRRLEAHGVYSIEHGDEYGRFGRMTDAAVRAFQTMRDLPSDGIVSTEVWVPSRHIPRTLGSPMGTALVRAPHPCDIELTYTYVDEPALLRAGGYGGMQRSTFVHCPACQMIRLVAVTTHPPPAD